MSTNNKCASRESHIKKISKFLKWIVPQIVSALLIAAAIWGSSYLIQNLNKIHEEDKIINDISLGVSNEYLNYTIGVPKIEFVDKYGYNNCFYKLDTVTVRGILDNNVLVSYFITITDNKRKISISEIVPLCNDEKLGKVKFSQIQIGENINYPDYVDGNVSANLVYEYYYETYYYGNSGQYNYYCYAILPYGYIHKDSGNLLFNFSEYYLKNDEKERDITLFKDERMLARPNTIGVINKDYIEEINPVFPNDDWNWYTSDVLN